VVNLQPSFTVTDRLATQTFAASGIPLNPPVGQPFFTISADFSAANLQFNAGDRVGIALRSTSPQFGGYSWWESESNLYAGGHVSSLRLSDNLLITHGDAHFATYMLVPEPQAVMQVAACSFICFLSGRSRRCWAACHKENDTLFLLLVIGPTYGLNRHLADER
jgi:hypothetical protein